MTRPSTGRAAPGRRPPSESSWTEWSAREAPKIDAAIRAAIPRAGDVPSSLSQAMRYALFPGGKRLRPLLAVLGHRSCGGRHPEIYRLSAACEMVHTFTLIHDDLPCMDDDDFRRGRPTCHKAFGEATAVLAGDALLNLAYEVLSNLRCAPSHKAALIQTLTRAVGGSGVLGGQIDDLEAEGREIGESRLRRIHERKTASLIAASLRMGAILGGAPRARIVALDRFGTELGNLFQIVDDLLNVEGTEEALGRPAGGDERLRKASYPRIVGLDGTRRRIRMKGEAAREAASVFGGMAPLFSNLVDVVMSRVRCHSRKEGVA